MKSSSYWEWGVAKQEMRNDKEIIGDQIIMSCFLNKKLKLKTVNVMLDSSTLAAFLYQFTYLYVESYQICLTSTLKSKLQYDSALDKLY